MNKNNYNIFVVNEEKEQKLFKNAYVVFDTSALLDFYYYSESTRRVIFDELFTKLHPRLLITSQTEFEFLKNRELVFKKPIESYENLKKKSTKNSDGGHIEEIEKKIKDISDIIKTGIAGQLKTLIEKTSKTDKHPFF